MRVALRLGLAVVLFALGGLASPVARATHLGPDGTPRVYSSTEVDRYSDGARLQCLIEAGYAEDELDALPATPTAEQVKRSDLRKRLLDLRLVIDFNAYAYDPEAFGRHRDIIDNAYDRVGEYKDLFDIQAIDGAPIDPDEQAARLARMNEALAPLRQGRFRDELERFFGQRDDRPRALSNRDKPRLWQIAGVDPSNAYDSAGNAALLGQSVLRKLRERGLLVGDIFDPNQEIRFHDTRKALRSAMVLADMFATLSNRVDDARDPLAKLIKAYGVANDHVVAYHAAQANGREPERRAAELREAFDQAQELARHFVDDGQLEAYAARLEQVQRGHRR